MQGYYRKVRDFTGAFQSLLYARPRQSWFFPSLGRAFATHNREKICPGCGSTITHDFRKPGYIKPKSSSQGQTARDLQRAATAELFANSLANLDEDVREQIMPSTDAADLDSSAFKAKNSQLLCTRCHSLKHHSCIPSEIGEEKASSFDIYQIIRKDPDALVVNVIDVMDFPLSLLDLRKHIGTRPRIVHVFNRMDILFKQPLRASDAKQKLLQLLSQDIAAEDKLHVRYTSAIKGWEVDKLASTLRTRKRQTNIYFVGSANAGKSSLISSLGLRAKSPALTTPTTSHVPGTTLLAIPTEIEAFGSLLGGGRGRLTDLPGILKPGLSSYIREEALQQSLPHKYINAKPRSLRIGESLILGDLIQIEHLAGDQEHVLVTPYTQLTPHSTSRPDHILSKLSSTRSDSSPAFETAFEQEFVVGERGGQNVVDLVFKDIGFVSLAVWKGKAKIRVRTPGGLHAGIRTPSIIENSYERT